MMDLDPDPEHCGMYRAGVDQLKIPHEVKWSEAGNGGRKKGGKKREKGKGGRKKRGQKREEKTGKRERGKKKGKKVEGKGKGGKKGKEIRGWENVKRSKWIKGMN